MTIPTEPIGSIPRPVQLIEAIKRSGDSSDPQLDPLYDMAIRHTVERFEATGSPVISDGEQRKYQNFWTYSVQGLPNTAPDGFAIPFVNGKVRRMQRLVAGPFRYRVSADRYLQGAMRYAHVPVKQAVISPSALSLMYPAAGIPGYSRDQFIDDLLREHESEVRRCLDPGAYNVQIDFTEARLAIKIDPSGHLLNSFIELNNLAKVKIDSVDANRLIEGLIALIKQTFPKTIELRADLAPHLSSIMVDGNQLEQALLNLAVNARDAMPQGGNLIFRTTAVDGASLRKLGEPSAARYVCIEVVDDGAGMDERVQQRIFEPFFTTKEMGQGTGLGLSVVYAIIKNHNGFIDLETKPMSGTIFRLYLPTGQSVDKPALKLAGVTGLETTEQSNGRGTILVVEDEKNMLHLLEKVLLKHGYQVLLASDGQMALDIYNRRKNEIDAVLLDIGLPKRAGRDVLFKMKEENPDIKLVVTSGYLDPGLKSYIKEAGIHHFISKPYVPAEVVQTLQSLMEDKRSA